jgi:hypothetical protein
MTGVSLQQSNAEIKNLTNKAFNLQSNLDADSKAFSELNSKRTIQDLINHVTKLENLILGLNAKLDNYLVPSQQKLFFTRDEVCEMLNVSLPTLNSWEKANILIPDRIGTRVRYTLEGIEKAFRK